VRCFVEQTYLPRELLILNEGEETIGVEAGNIREIRIEKVATRTLGDLRNLALELAYGDWLIQWDDDDWYGPERIEAQMRARRSGAAVLVGIVDLEPTGPRDFQVAFFTNAMARFATLVFREKKT
jgi:glycosyltransferase involved in cell wall biosynthesis